MKKRVLYPWSLAIVIGVLLLIGCGRCRLNLYRALMTDESLMNRQRTLDVPANRDWAKPIGLPGVTNLHKVSNDLYRGAQPTQVGVRQLKTLGIKTFVNLRTLHSDRNEIGPAKDVNYEHIAAQPWDVEQQDVIRFLRVVTDPNQIPVYVHCQRGADRTGVMCAVYRIVVQGWTKDQALAEMTEGGFGFYKGWTNLIEYIRDLDVERLKQQASLSAVPISNSQ